MIVLSAFNWVPPFAQGLVRDLRVRWALEEAGWPYEERLLDLQSKNSPEYRKWQPFGQVPAFEEDELELFESGAIVLHIAERTPALMPRDEAARAREDLDVRGAELDRAARTESRRARLLPRGQGWAKERRPAVEQRSRTRLAELAAALDEREYLVDDRFTAATC